MVRQKFNETAFRARKKNSIYPYVKRGLDILGAIILLVLLSPVLLVTAIIILSKMGRPVLFRQLRPGRNSRNFLLTKFRTMRSTDAVGVDATDDDADRLTPLGKRLRALSIDELPELINILIGDMSFIGPRPLLVDYLQFYSVEQSRRHEVRPGITGLAQIMGRNALEWEDRFFLDVYYVDHLSFKLDWYIFTRTFRVVLSGEGVTAENHATVGPFKGACDKIESDIHTYTRI